MSKYKQSFIQNGSPWPSKADGNEYPLHLLLLNPVQPSYPTELGLDWNEWVGSFIHVREHASANITILLKSARQFGCDKKNTKQMPVFNSACRNILLYKCPTGVLNEYGPPWLTIIQLNNSPLETAFYCLHWVFLLDWCLLHSSHNTVCWPDKRAHHWFPPPPYLIWQSLTVPD